MDTTRPRDFLVSPRPEPSEFPPLAEQNTTLRQILHELRKTHPNQRCVVDLQFNRADKLLTNPNDRCRVSFMNQNLPVLSQYTVVSNNGEMAIAVGVNEPVGEIDTALPSAGGILLGGGEKLFLPIEIQFLDLATVQVGPVAVSVNNAVDITTAPNGIIQVYGWTIPSESYARS